MMALRQKKSVSANILARISSIIGARFAAFRLGTAFSNTQNTLCSTPQIGLHDRIYTWFLDF